MVKKKFAFEMNAADVHSIIQHIMLDDDIKNIVYCPQCGMCEFTRSPLHHVGSIVCDHCSSWYSEQSLTNGRLINTTPDDYLENVIKTIPLKYGGWPRPRIMKAGTHDMKRLLEESNWVTYHDLSDEQIKELEQCI